MFPVSLDFVEVLSIPLHVAKVDARFEGTRRSDNLSSHLVAFRCGGRGFCPGCTGRRMAATAANLTEFVLPDAPLRQWVLTVPHGLRAAIAYDRQLLPRLYRIFYSSIQRFYEHRMAEHGQPGGRTGSVTAIQRCSSDLRLNPHLHGVWLDAVYLKDADGQLSWSSLPALSDRDVQEVLQTVIARLLAWLRRDGRLTHDNALWPAEPDDEQQLVLGALASAAVTGSSLAGPEVRPGRVPQLHLAAGQPRRRGRLLAASDGFTLHARTTVAEGDKAGRERLIKYILRPPVAADRVQRLPGGRVRLTLKRPFADGTWADRAYHPCQGGPHLLNCRFSQANRVPRKRASARDHPWEDRRSNPQSTTTPTGYRRRRVPDTDTKRIRG